MNGVWSDEIFADAEAWVSVSSSAGVGLMGGGPFSSNTIGTSGSGNGSSNNSANSQQPVLTYRRNTHDENGNPKSLNQAQEQAWADSWPIGAMTSDIIWKTAEEIARDANAYIQFNRVVGNAYHSTESVSEVLSALAVYGLVESK